MHRDTLSVYLGRETDSATGAAASGIPLPATFECAADGSYPSGFSYACTDKPAWQGLEACMAGLERGSGALSFAFSSAVPLAVFSLLHGIAPPQRYHATLEQLRELMSRRGVTSAFVDTTDLGAVAEAFTPRLRRPSCNFRLRSAQSS